MKLSRTSIYLFAGIISMSSIIAQAETVYVNDRIYLGVYAEPNTDGKAILTLQSGGKLEVLERVEGFVRIQTEGKQEGWVRESFISEQKPASLRIKEVEQERDKLQATVKAIPTANEVTQLKSDLAKAEDQIKALVQERNRLQTTIKTIPSADEVVVLKNDLAKADNQIKELKDLLNEQVAASKDVEKLAAKNAPAKPIESVDLTKAEMERWYERAIIGSTFLLLGLIFGFMIMAKRIKKRFGGYKVW